MSAIKKVNNADFYCNNKYEELVEKGKKEIKDDLAQIYLDMDPIDNYSEVEPSSVSEMVDLIDCLESNMIPLGVRISIIARIVALSYVNMLNGEGTSWGAAGAKHEGPDTIQYDILHEIAENKRKAMGIEDYDYARGSCAQAVATVIISTFDENFPVTSPFDQERYLMKKTDLYEFIGNVEYSKPWENVEPGDILVSETIDGHKHIMLCVGIKDGNIPLIFEAAAVKDSFSMYPIVTEREVNNDAFERTYHIFRPKEKNDISEGLL